MSASRTWIAAVFVAASAVAGTAVAGNPPPAPGDVVVTDITSLTYKRGGFILEFRPVAGYAKYQFTVAPKFCSFKNTSNGTGNFPTATFAGAPYRVMVECNCRSTYTVSVATAPPDAYTSRSSWVQSLPFTIPCAAR